jgi:hypothetical protein
VIKSSGAGIVGRIAYVRPVMKQLTRTPLMRTTTRFTPLSCSDLITSARLLDYIPGVQLAFCENSGSLLLTLPDNMLGFSEKSLITSSSTCIN